tara:strand:- start:1033 stop:1275 length:243 start_codon:yes stop_codon:yes gene_type:complete
MKNKFINTHNKVISFNRKVKSLSAESMKEAQELVKPNIHSSKISLRDVIDPEDLEFYYKQVAKEKENVIEGEKYGRYSIE